MAEQEVIKHTKKIFTAWGNKKHSFWEKFREFVIEILIIVFAVSLSIWFHERSEHAHQQSDVRAFLTGLRTDLASDIREMESDKKSYNAYHRLFSYLSGVGLKDVIIADSVKPYWHLLFSRTALVANNGRYEGFRSSGKIGTIENKELQNEIMNLYAEKIPGLLLSTDLYLSSKRELAEYVNKNLVRSTDHTTNMTAVLATPEAYNRAGRLNDVSEIIGRYDECIRQSNLIISMIDNEYGR
jgi:hypothetical protein